MAAKETEKMTIEQVADALGLSKTTVSRALSGKGRISEATRTKVYAYMGRTRSEPVSAQSGEKLRTNNIAMVVPQRFIALDLPFLRKCMGGICTMAADPAKLEDPSLIIYNPVLTLGRTHIVTNGDQTDTIYDLMSQGKSFADALRTRTFEPDGPNYTPRISAVVYADGSYQMSILKSADGNGDSVQRYFFDYPQPVAGEGHFISTYKHNGSPIPSFEGEPLRFACPRTLGDFAHGLWSSLNVDNKVSLFARVIDLESGESGDMIFNKYDAVCSDLDDPEEPELLPEELELLKKLDAEEE